jgi:hypothetical protein
MPCQHECRLLHDVPPAAATAAGGGVSSRASCVVLQVDCFGFWICHVCATAGVPWAPFRAAIACKSPSAARIAAK